MTRGRRQRHNSSRDLSGRLMTQSGPRTTAPMWPRPFFTPGEWAVYTALWSYPNDSVFPTHQDLADRAWVERGTAADAVAKMDRLNLLDREPAVHDDGSTSSNTYFLVEVATAEHLELIEAKKAERAVEQEDKRRKRKAGNRKYEKPQVNVGTEGGYGQESTPARTTRGGTVRKVPRGYGQESTPGGTAQAVPGYGVDRTHESLGVTKGSSVTRRRSSASSGEKPASLTAVEQTEEQTPERKDDLFPEMENQELGYASDGYPLDVTEQEADLIAELGRLRPEWGPRHIRIAVGHPSVRARAATDSGLVRRAFLLAAADKPRPREGYKGTYSVRRLTVDGCPLWERAVAEIEAEEAAELDLGQPEFETAVPVQRPATVAAPSVVSPPHEEYLAARARLAAGKASVSV